MRADRKETVHIGYRNYDIVFVKKIDGEKSHGECIYPKHPMHGKGKIRILKGQDGIEKSNTILHEIFHAIARDKGLELSDAMEERIVCAFTNGLVAFIKDNPKFFINFLLLMFKKKKPAGK